MIQLGGMALQQQEELSGLPSSRNKLWEVEYGTNVVSYCSHPLGLKNEQTISGLRVIAAL